MTGILLVCFNPYSFGCVAERIWKTKKIVVCLGFQSLFFWMCRWKYYRRWCALYCQVVSILILLDVSLKAPASQAYKETAKMFQSLFFWMCRWKCASRSWLELWKKVSILILLDVSLKVGHVNGALKLCFVFQSLFFWMCRWKLYALGRMGLHFSEFQSLFFWMCRWKCVRSATKRVSQVVSILILLDVSLKECFAVIVLVTPRGFQSLFFWMCRWKSYNSKVAVFILHEFQSLFFWMCRWKSFIWKWATTFFCVSILILLDVSLKVFVHSCIYFSHTIVSILILLDVSLKALSRHSSASCFIWCFNPYSFGCVAERLRPYQSQAITDLCFNPYSFGCVAERAQRKS